MTEPSGNVTVAAEIQAAREEYAEEEAQAAGMEATQSAAALDVE